MALSNSYQNMQHRIKGKVGLPLPNVDAVIVNEAGDILDELNAVGELRIKGPCLFKEYLHRPTETENSFDLHGWFKTGDVAIKTESGFQLLGRMSSDIIKSCGYKLSSLEIEREILGHKFVKEVAVIGWPHNVEGERVTAVVVLRDNTNSQSNSTTLSLQELQQFLADKLARYKIPKTLLIRHNIPRNHMGKVNKKNLLASLLNECK